MEYKDVLSTGSRERSRRFGSDTTYPPSAQTNPSLACGADPEPTQELRITAVVELERLVDAVGCLGRRVDDLEGALRPVLVPAVPVSNKLEPASQQPWPPESPMLSEIRGLIARTNPIIEQIEDMIARLEL